jgi:hypothetical protein
VQSAVDFGESLDDVDPVPQEVHSLDLQRGQLAPAHPRVSGGVDESSVAHIDGIRQPRYLVGLQETHLLVRRIPWQLDGDARAAGDVASIAAVLRIFAKAR